MFGSALWHLTMGGQNPNEKKNKDNNENRNYNDRDAANWVSQRKDQARQKRQDQSSKITRKRSSNDSDQEDNNSNNNNNNDPASNKNKTNNNNSSSMKNRNNTSTTATHQQRPRLPAPPHLIKNKHAQSYYDEFYRNLPNSYGDGGGEETTYEKTVVNSAICCMVLCVFLLILSPFIGLPMLVAARRKSFDLIHVPEFASIGFNFEAKEYFHQLNNDDEQDNNDDDDSSSSSSDGKSSSPLFPMLKKGWLNRAQTELREKHHRHEEERKKRIRDVENNKEREPTTIHFDEKHVAAIVVLRSGKVTPQSDDEEDHQDQEKTKSSSSTTLPYALIQSLVEAPQHLPLQVVFSLSPETSRLFNFDENNFDRELQETIKLISKNTGETSKAFLGVSSAKLSSTTSHQKSSQVVNTLHSALKRGNYQVLFSSKIVLEGKHEDHHLSALYQKGLENISPSAGTVLFLSDSIAPVNPKTFIYQMVAEFSAVRPYSSSSSDSSNKKIKKSNKNSNNNNILIRKQEKSDEKQADRGFFSASSSSQTTTTTQKYSLTPITAMQCGVVSTLEIKADTLQERKKFYKKIEKRVKNSLGGGGNNKMTINNKPKKNGLSIEEQRTYRDRLVHDEMARSHNKNESSSSSSSTFISDLRTKLWHSLFTDSDTIKVVDSGWTIGLSTPPGKDSESSRSVSLFTTWHGFSLRSAGFQAPEKTVEEELVERAKQEEAERQGILLSKAEDEIVDQILSDNRRKRRQQQQQTKQHKQQQQKKEAAANDDGGDSSQDLLIFDKSLHHQDQQVKPVQNNNNNNEKSPPPELIKQLGHDFTATLSPNDRKMLEIERQQLMEDEIDDEADELPVLVDALGSHCIIIDRLSLHAAGGFSSTTSVESDTDQLLGNVVVRNSTKNGDSEDENNNEIGDGSNSNSIKKPIDFKSSSLHHKIKTARHHNKNNLKKGGWEMASLHISQLFLFDISSVFMGLMTTLMGRSVAGVTVAKRRLARQCVGVGVEAVNRFEDAAGISTSVLQMRWGQNHRPWRVHYSEDVRTRIEYCENSTSFIDVVLCYCDLVKETGEQIQGDYRTANEFSSGKFPVPDGSPGWSLSLRLRGLEEELQQFEQLSSSSRSDVADSNPKATRMKTIKNRIDQILLQQKYSGENSNNNNYNIQHFKNLLRKQLMKRFSSSSSSTSSFRVGCSRNAIAFSVIPTSETSSALFAAPEWLNMFQQHVLAPSYQLYSIHHGLFSKNGWSEFARSLHPEYHRVIYAHQLEHLHSNFYDPIVVTRFISRGWNKLMSLFEEDSASISNAYGRDQSKGQDNTAAENDHNSDNDNQNLLTENERKEKAIQESWNKPLKIAWTHRHSMLATFARRKHTSLMNRWSQSHHQLVVGNSNNSSSKNSLLSFAFKDDNEQDLMSSIRLKRQKLFVQKRLALSPVLRRIQEEEDADATGRKSSGIVLSPSSKSDLDEVSSQQQKGGLWSRLSLSFLPASSSVIKKSSNNNNEAAAAELRISEILKKNANNNNNNKKNGGKMIKHHHNWHSHNNLPEDDDDEEVKSLLLKVSNKNNNNNEVEQLRFGQVVTWTPSDLAKMPFIRVVWFAICCGCCGFSAEIAHFTRPLSHLYPINVLLGPDCFCPGYESGFADTIGRAHLRPDKYTRLEYYPGEVMVWISHTDPLSYRRMDFFHRRHPTYIVGRSMYEFTRIPREWEHGLHNNANEIWVPSEFVFETFLAAGADPHKLRIVPEGIDTRFFDPDVHAPLRIGKRVNVTGQDFRKKFGLKWENIVCNRPPTSSSPSTNDSDAEYIFFSQFKWEPRKGWQYLFESYFRAFTKKKYRRQFHHNNNYNENSNKNEKKSEEETFSSSSSPVPSPISANRPRFLSPSFHSRKRYTNNKRMNKNTNKNNKKTHHSLFERAQKLRQLQQKRLLQKEKKIHDSATFDDEEDEPNVALVVLSILYSPETKKTYTDNHDTKIGMQDLEDIATKLFPDPENRPSLSELPRFCLLFDGVSEKEMAQLFRGADAFVLPTRGEGWGLPTMQAMSMGLPVISTNWGGSVDFTTKETSYLIELDGVEEVHRRIIYGWRQGKKWATPSVSHLTHLLKSVYKNRVDAVAVGQRAREHIIRNYDDFEVVRVVDRRLQEIAYAERVKGYWSR